MHSKKTIFPQASSTFIHIYNNFVGSVLTAESPMKISIQHIY